MSASSSKSSSSREWLTIGAGLAIVVVVIFVISTIGSLNGFYNEFHAAYLEGNCKRAGELYVDFTANPPLFDLSGLTAKIEADWAECKPYADLERLFEYGAPEFVERWVENYEAFVKQYPDSHLVALLKQRVEDKLNNPEESISYPYFCTSLADLALYPVFTENPNIDLPQLEQTIWLRCANVLKGEFSGLGKCTDCGGTQDTAAHYFGLVEYIDTFRKRYPDHPDSATAENLMAEVMQMQADAAEAGTIQQPSPVGTSGGDDVLFTIQNDSPHTLRLGFTLTEARVEDVEPCSTCEEYSTPPEFCPEKGPVVSYHLKPGLYNIVVYSMDENGVTPFRGSWQMDGGLEYYSCFFITKSSR